MENRSLGELKGFRMPRRYRAVALTIWPGLAQIWLGQEALGLLLGVCFASTLNLAIVSRWIWKEAFAPGWSDFFLILAVAWWLASVAYTLWWVGVCHPDRHRAEIDRLYREAQEAYLQGRWRDSKRRLERILAWDETDADALMQLATLYQRTDQPDLARQALQQCLQLKQGEKWRWEIQQALARLGSK
jgi:tetratricopeptide (TPR) repeat protein